MLNSMLRMKKNTINYRRGFYNHLTKVAPNAKLMKAFSSWEIPGQLELPFLQLY